MNGQVLDGLLSEKTHGLTLATCRDLTPPKHPVVSPPRRIQYGRRRKVILFYIHIVELSANLTAIQQFYLITYQFLDTKYTPYLSEKY